MRRFAYPSGGAWSLTTRYSTNDVLFMHSEESSYEIMPLPAGYLYPILHFVETRPACRVLSYIPWTARRRSQHLVPMSVTHHAETL